MRFFVLLAIVLCIAHSVCAQLRFGVTQATDNFNRADQDMISGAGGWSQQNGVGKMVVASNVSTSSAGADCGAVYTGITWSNDQYAQAKMTVTGGSASGYTGPSILLRGSTSAYTYYQISINAAATNNLGIARFVASTWTGLQLTTTAWTSGDVLRAEIRTVGTTAVINVYRNGTLITTYTDSTPIASGSAGLSYSSATTTRSLDDWEGGVLRQPGIGPTRR